MLLQFYHVSIHIMAFLFILDMVLDTKDIFNSNTIKIIFVLQYSPSTHEKKYMGTCLIKK